MKNKKAQIEQLQGLVIALIVIAIILVVGFLIFDQTKDQVVSLISATTITNESYSYANNTLVHLTHSSHSAHGSVACSAVYNDTTRLVPITSGNYTCDHNGLIITDTGAHANWSSTMYVDYTYKAADYAYNASSKVQNATQDIPGWLPIIVITVIGALLLGLVAMFRRR